MSSSEPNTVSSVAAPVDTQYSLLDVKRAVAFGQALGAFEQYSEYADNLLDIRWKIDRHDWTIIAQYDSQAKRRDAEAEDTFHYHASMRAPHATAIVLDAEGNRLEPLED
jgi:hypothetical protein